LEERIHKLQSELVKFQTLADDYKQTIKELETLSRNHAAEMLKSSHREQQLKSSLEQSEINVLKLTEEVRMLNKLIKQNSDDRNQASLIILNA
jgi:type II secretory pathway component PulM